MIVRHFLSWIRNASAGERADATHALARAYLVSDLSRDDRAATEGALLMLLDDPSPLVRQAMADVFAASADAPAAIVHALANDQLSIALPVLEFSPLLLDADLVDMVATGAMPLQSAIARRCPLPLAVCAAIAEVGAPEACLELLENPGATLAEFSLGRIVERHGHLAAIREALLVRDDLPPAIRLTLVGHVAEVLSRFVVARNWLTDERAERVAEEARFNATVSLAADSRGAELPQLVHHLQEIGQLTPALILRALLSGNMELFEQALVELSGMPSARVAALIADRNGGSIKALLVRAGFPGSTIIAFRAALAAMHETGFAATVGDVSRLRRMMVERVITACADAPSADVEPLMIMLRRFATEAAREEARLYCSELETGSWRTDDEEVATHIADGGYDADGQDDAAYDDPAYGEAEYDESYESGGDLVHAATDSYAASSDDTAYDDAAYDAAAYNDSAYSAAVVDDTRYDLNACDSGTYDAPAYDHAAYDHAAYEHPAYDYGAHDRAAYARARRSVRLAA